MPSTVIAKQIYYSPFGSETHSQKYNLELMIDPRDVSACTDNRLKYYSDNINTVLLNSIKDSRNL
jgi:hypothetical protein